MLWGLDFGNPSAVHRTESGASPPSFLSGGSPMLIEHPTPPGPLLGLLPQALQLDRFQEGVGCR